MAWLPEAQVIVPQRLKTLQVQKIGVIRRNGVGDLLMAQPLLRWCQRHLQAQIVLIVDPRNRECAEWIDQPAWSELLVMASGNRYLAAGRMAAQLRRRKLDLVISAKSSAMKMISCLLALSGARSRCAVVGAPGLLGRFCERWVDWPVNSKELASYPHQAEQLLHLLAGPGQTLEPSLWPQMRPVPALWREHYRKICQEQGLLGQAPCLYLNLSNNRLSSRLGLEQTYQALGKLSGSCELLLGVLPADLALARAWQQRLRKELGWPVGILVGHTLALTLAALEQVEAVLTGDGGLMHLAAASGRAQLALFGRTLPSRWHPLSDRARWLFHPEAIELLSPDLVASELEQLLLGAVR